MIDPNEINTTRVGQLPSANINLTNNIAHEVGTDLKRATIEDLSIFIAAYIGASDGVGFRAVTVTDGQTLPTTTNQEFILVGKGTFYNVNGGQTIVTTNELNAIVSNGSYWFIGVEIPVNVELAGIVQTIRQGEISTAPSEAAVFSALNLKANDNEVVKLTGTQTITGDKFFTKQIKVGNGTLLQPSLTFYDEASSDTGFNHNTDGRIDVVLNGVIKSSFNLNSFDINTPINIESATTIGNELILNSSGNTNLFFQQSGVTKWIVGYIPSISGFRFSNGVSDILTLANTGAATFSSSVTATSHVTTGGTASQFVKGDGSLTVGYKVYTALLTQSGTSAPVANVLENTLGGTFVWSRTSAGLYLGTLTGVFIGNKTVVFFQSGKDVSGSLFTYYAHKQDDNSIRLQAQSNGVYADINSVGQIEIRVYN